MSTVDVVAAVGELVATIGDGETAPRRGVGDPSVAWAAGRYEPAVGDQANLVGIGVQHYQGAFPASAPARTESVPRSSAR